MGKNKPACDRCHAGKGKKLFPDVNQAGNPVRCCGKCHNELKSGARFQMAKQAKLSFGSSGTWTKLYRTVPSLPYLTLPY